MAAAQTSPATGDIAKELVNLGTGAGIVFVAMAPLALPVVVLTIAALLPLLAPAVVLGIVAGPIVLAVRLLRRRRATAA